MGTGYDNRILNRKKGFTAIIQQHRHQKLHETQTTEFLEENSVKQVELILRLFISLIIFQTKQTQHLPSSGRGSQPFFYFFWRMVS
jgi:hypothetical protein